MTDRTFVRVWDVPTRLFHWALFALVILCWFTAEGEGALSSVHRYAGEAIAGLIVFRVIWGFVGGEHARFAAFFEPGEKMGDHIAGLFTRKAHPTLGHNPLGSLAVIALLLVVSAVVVTGLMSEGEQEGGPLALVFGVNLSELHEVSFRVLQGLVAIHLIGVAVTSWATRDNLTGAMVTGRKARPAGSAHDARPAKPVAFIIAAVLAAAAAGGLMLMPHPLGEGGEAAGALDHGGGDADD